MKKATLIIVIILFPICLFAQHQSLEGVYKASSNGINTLWLFTENYCSQTLYKDNQYIGTKGGPYHYEKGKLTINLEYNDTNTTSVGSKEIHNVSNTASQIKIDNIVYKKTKTQQQDLDGLWRITGRKSGDEIRVITRGDRKTIKILVDGHFQWIAINPAEKGFYGTGGGKYAFEQDQYHEHILFFSRDNSRVGNDLHFEGRLDNQTWHHSGKSSKGDPIYEFWERD